MTDRRTQHCRLYKRECLYGRRRPINVKWPLEAIHGHTRTRPICGRRRAGRQTTTDYI